MEKLMLSHEEFVLTTEDSDTPGLRVYVPRPPPSPINAADLAMYLAVRETDDEDEDPELKAAIARSIESVYGPGRFR